MAYDCKRNDCRSSHTIQTITVIFDRLGLGCVALDGPTHCRGTDSAHCCPLATGRTPRRRSGGFR